MKEIIFYKLLVRIEEGKYRTFYAYNDKVYNKDICYIANDCNTSSFRGDMNYFYGCLTIEDVHKYLYWFLKDCTNIPKVNTLTICKCKGICKKIDTNSKGISVCYCISQTILSEVIDVIYQEAVYGKH